MSKKLACAEQLRLSWELNRKAATGHSNVITLNAFIANFLPRQPELSEFGCTTNPKVEQFVTELRQKVCVGVFTTHHI